MKKNILGSGIGILILGIIVGIFWRRSPQQVVLLGNDIKITLLAVDYGKHHVLPVIKPTPGHRLQRNITFDTSGDTLMLWMRQDYDPKQHLYFDYYVSDKSGSAYVRCDSAYGGGGDVVAVRVDAFPRRESKFYVRVNETGNGNDQTGDKLFVIRNPVRKSFPNWPAETLPDTQSDGNLSVTLTKLVVEPNKNVQATLHIEHDGQTVTNWQPIWVGTSDASGNGTGGAINRNNWQDSDDTVTYQNGLWQDEPIWKTRFEFSQQSDFAPEELWSVQNIPLQPDRWRDFNRNVPRLQSDPVFAETDLNGFHLKLFPAKRFTDAPSDTMQGGFYLQIKPRLPAGTRLTLLKLTDDQNNDVQKWEQGPYGNNNATTYLYYLRNISGVTNMNLALALHKSRFVEFTIKPTKQ